MNMADLAIFQAWIWVRVCIGKFLFVCVLETFLATVVTCFGCMLASVLLTLSLRSYNGLDIRMG